MPALTAADARVGDTLPELRVMMTTQKIISAAAATRDWQPIHHDQDIAIKSGLRGIILNSPSQAGWISRYITDWAGSHATIKRMAFKMKDSICAGDDMLVRGEITAIDNGIITATVSITAGDKLKTTAEVRFSLPPGPA
jgi:acyl dehydratase